MRTTSTLFCVLAILAGLAAAPAVAKDDPLEFLHLLQREGYPDVAIDYLEQLKADPNPPPEVMELWDLEMSRSKQEAVQHDQALNESQAKQWSEDSKALLDRFIKANPDRPESIQEAARLAEERAMEGQYKVQRASYAPDKEQKAKLLAEARAIFEEIRPRFVDAEKASAKLLAKLSPKQKRELRGESAFINVGENRLTVAIVDFYLAQTLEDPTARTAALNKSMKDFDSIYQDFRTADDPRKELLALRAHFWNARILQELGDAAKAEVFFEEVAVGDSRNIDDATGGPVKPGTRQPARPRAQKATGLENFFADVEQYYLKALYETSKPDYLEEVKDWRGSHKAISEKCYGYQALTLEYAKNLLEMGKQANKEAAAKRDALKLLAEMAKVASPFRQDAILLQRQLNPDGSSAHGFEDCVDKGNEALEKKNWPEAIENYEKALEAVNDKTDKQILAAVQNALVGCYHSQAMQLYRKGKLEEAVVTAKKALKAEFLHTKTAPGIAVFLLNVLHYQYQNAPESTEAEKTAKSELLAKVAGTARSIIKIWAAKEEADAARIVLMRLAQSQGKMAEADKILSEINPDSKEYPTALTEIGYSHWTSYKGSKKRIKADAAKNIAADKATIDKSDEDRRLAVDFIQKAVQALTTAHSEGGAMPDALRNGQMLLAEISLEGNDFKQAASLYRPLVDDLLKDANRPFDVTALRIFTGAGQAYLQLNDADNLSAVGAKLVELGPDEESVNRAIMGFAMGLKKERENAMVQSESPDPAVQDRGAAKVKSLTDLQEKIMINLSKRKALSCKELVWIVKTTCSLGTDNANAAAAELIDAIFDRGNNDQDFAKELEKDAVGLHALGASLQAQLGNYEKAKDQIDAVITQYPRRLAPRVSEAKILTEWAAKVPAKYDEAIAKWDTLRRKLDQPRPKAGDAKGINPKYDVIYSEADCFYRWSQKSNEAPKAKAKTGLDLLVPYLSLDPNIRAPSEEFKELSIKYFRLGGKLADFLGVPRPLRPAIKRTASR